MTEQAMKLQSDLAENEVLLTPDQAQKLYTFYDMLIETNKVMNLTAITAYEDVLVRHFVDSLYLTEEFFEKDTKPLSVIDVGCGAGFPSLPLAIRYPHLKMTFLDSLQKRLTFINRVTQAISLENTQLIHSRAEDCGKNVDYREQFDFAISRAVSQLSVLCEYCLPLVKPGGYFLAYKGKEGKEELKEAEKAIRILGGSVEKVKEFTLPHTDFNRCFILIKKTKNTPKQYPRKAGLPARSPLS